MLIDTSGFFSLHNADEQYHRAANELNSRSRTKITTNYILAEYAALAIVRGLPRRKVTEFVMRFFTMNPSRSFG